MARLFAQFWSPVFLLVGVGGLFLGSAGTPDSSGEAGGNLGPVILHLSTSRHILDMVTFLILVWVGFLAPRRPARIAVGMVGAWFLALAVTGFVVGDDKGATRGLLGFHFPIGDDVFDLVVGVLGVLAFLGTLSDTGTAAHSARRSVLRG